MSDMQHKMIGNKLVIEIDITALDVNNAPLSSTGRTRLVYSSGRPIHIATVAGKPVSFSLNVMTTR